MNSNHWNEEIQTGWKGELQSCDQAEHGDGDKQMLTMGDHDVSPPSALGFEIARFYGFNSVIILVKWYALGRIGPCVMARFDSWLWGKLC